MRDEFFWTLIVLVWVFGWATVWLIRRRAEDLRSMKLRDLLHKERMTAMEKGVPLPEIPADEEPIPVWLRPETDRARALWLRRMSLALGLLCLFAGIGICAAFYWAPDKGWYGMWTIGLIPGMAGIGFLLYAVLSRARADKDL